MVVVFGHPGLAGHIPGDCHCRIELDRSTERGQSGFPGCHIPVADQDFLTGSEDIQAEFTDNPNHSDHCDLTGRGEALNALSS